MPRKTKRAAATEAPAADAPAPVGIGIIGAGRVAGQHAEAAGRVPTVALRAVAELDPARRDTFLAERGGDGTVAGHGDYNDLLARDDVELVIVTLPHLLHLEVTLAALEAGKNVLVEKPMGLSLGECDRMIALAREKALILAVGQTHHFYGPPVEAKKILDSGKYGKIIWGSEVVLSPRPYGTNPEWLYDRAQGGGQLLANGVHFVDRLLWTIAGPTDVAAPARLIRARPVSVNAIVGTYFNTHEPRYKSDDGTVLMIRFDTGQVATLHLTGHARGVAGSYAEYVCEHGMVRYEGKRVLTSNLDDPADRTYHEIEVGSGGYFAGQLTDVADAIRRGRPPAVPGEWGRQIVEILLAAEESGRRGREIRLD